MFLRPLPLLQRRLPRCLRSFVPTPGLTPTPLSTLVSVTPLWASGFRCCSTNSNSNSNNGKGNFFAFFSLAVHPEVDVPAMQKVYHDLQRRVHPDQQQVQQRERQAAAAPCVPDAATLQTSVDVSTYANAAYETLRSPYDRCRYLSRLVKAQQVKGAPLSPAEEEELRVEDDRRTMQAREVCPDAPMTQDFLMEMLTISELIFAGDAADEAVRRQWTLLKADLEDRAVGYYQDAVRQWVEGDMAAFHRTVQEWTYINNALNNVQEQMLRCG